LWLLSSNANSLYNYAAWSQDIHEQTTALEKILTRYADASRMSFIAAMIRYTRLLDEERAVASLGASSYTAQTPLLDLELWRRTEKNYPPGRAAAEIWRLIGRHIQENALYEYAAWYFGRNRQYEELSLLLKNAGQQGIDSPMLEYWRVLQEARTGETNAGREAFSALSFASGHPWYVSANIGRFYEAERSWKNALDNYYTALADAAENRDKSRILTRMAGCLAALGRSGEAYGVLEEAVSLDPGNLAARSALHNSK
jgi:tetratricopeptide (TPR) repeat protein